MQSIGQSISKLESWRHQKHWYI